MNRIIILLGSILFQAILFAQKGDTVTKYLDINIELTDKANMAYPAVAVKDGGHWFLYSLYPDTSLLLKIYFRDKALSVKDGPYTIYYPHNIKSQEGYFRENEAFGPWQFWYEDGQIRDSGRLENNSMTGVWKKWFQNGKPESVGHFSKPDISFPQATKENPRRPKDKSILLKTEKISFIRNGPWISWYENGRLKDSGDYFYEQKEGPWKYFYEDGKEQSTGIYKNDFFTGEWTWYHENGNLSTRETYANNKLTGLSCFDENGQYTGDLCNIIKMPGPLGNFSDLDTYIQDSTVWNEQMLEQARSWQTDPVVKVKFTITKEGKLTHFFILRSPGDPFRKEALRLFQGLTNWSPAISHNRPSDYTMEYDIQFH